jgi:hypothetical protein
MPRKRGGRSQQIKWPEFNDAFDSFPSSYSRAKIDKDKVITTPTLRSITPDYNNQDVSHLLLYTELGLTDNVEIIINWKVDGIWGMLPQVSPCGGINMAASDLEMGFKPVLDVGLPGKYFQNVFRCPEDDVMNVAYYDKYEDTGSGWPVTDFSKTNHWWMMRCVGGFINAWFDGELVSPTPVARPAHTVGIDGWGIDIIGIRLLLGYPFPNTTALTTYLPVIEVGDFFWREYSTPL